MSMPDQDNRISFEKTDNNKPEKNYRTKTLSHPRAQVIDEQEPSPFQSLRRPWRVSLTVVDLDIQIIFDITRSVTIGRSYPSREAFNGIDLSPFNAYENGVSREHATMLLQENQVIIRDNDSANGTLLNSKKLKPNTNYILRSGDRVNLAGIALRFDLLSNPLVGNDA